MPTKVDDADLEIPEFDWSRAQPNKYAPAPGEKTEICVDGAVGYSLRLIPSNKVLARFTSTLEAWPAIIEAVEAGRSPRTLALDWVGADGRGHKMSAGPFLLSFARVNNGEAHPTTKGAFIRRPRHVAAG